MKRIITIVSSEYDKFAIIKESVTRDDGELCSQHLIIDYCKKEIAEWAVANRETDNDANHLLCCFFAIEVMKKTQRSKNIIDVKKFIKEKKISIK